MPTDIALPAPVAESVRDARLPVNYEAAKIALTECERIDECAEWANRAEALASYARQADDPELENSARRIRARAVRRCGELLKEFDGRGGQKTESEIPLTSAPTRQEVAMRARLGAHQRLTAVRVANVPAERFEAMIESPRPLGTTLLAQIGKQARPKDEPVEILTGRSLSDITRQCRAKDALDLLLRLGATEADPSAVIDLLQDERNVGRLPKVRTALRYAERLKAALDKAELGAHGWASYLTIIQNEVPPHPKP